MELMQPTRRDSARRTCALPGAALTLGFVLAAGLLLAPPARAAEDQARILLRSGELFAKPEKGEPKAVAPEQAQVAGSETIESGAPVEEARRAETVKSAPKAHAVLSFSPREVVTLVTGATVHRSAKDAVNPHYTLTGPAHLLIHGPKHEGKDAPPLHVTVNGVTIEVTEAHLFFDGWKSPAHLGVVSGAAILPAPSKDAKQEAGAEGAAKPEEGAKGGAKAPAEAKPAGPIALGPGQVLVLDPKGPKLLASAKAAKPAAKGKGAKEDAAKPGPMDEEEGALLKWSTVAGYEAPGPYKHAGFAVPSDEKLTVKRNGLDSKLEGKRIPVMEGDELLVPAGQKVDVLLDSKDKITLTGEAKFKLEVFAAKNTLPAFVFNVFGKVRALISPKEPGSVQLKTVTAIIGVKGTDFETLASAGNTDVSVLEGKVGVGDAAGGNEVEVPAGQSTSVPAGGKPTPPKPMSPEKLKELQGEAPAPSALNIVAPVEGQTVSGGKIEFTVDPPSAAIEVLLDDKPLPNLKTGALLPELSDGAHKVTVRGTAPGALSKTVSFTVDRKPPVLDPAIALASLALVEGNPPPVLKWNKPLASVEATYEGKTFPLTLASDGQSAPLTLDAAVLKDAPTAIKLKATDKVGNSVTSDGMLTFRRKPTKAPVLTASLADAEWTTNAPTDLKVTVDREVASWEVTVGTQNLTDKVVPKAPEGAKDAKAPKDVTLTAALLLALQDGSHVITFKATDSFGLVGEHKLTLHLDRKPPAPTAKNLKDGAAVALPPAGGAAPVLKPGRYEFSAGKPLKTLHVQLDGQDQQIALNQTKDGFTLDAESLKPGEHSYKLQLADIAGNTRDLEVKVTVAAPVVAAPPPPPPPPAAAIAAAPVLGDREGVLRKAYEHSLAGETTSFKDQAYLSERTSFVFIPTTSGTAGALLSGGAVYRTGKLSSVGKDLPDAFIHGVTEQ